MAPKPGNAQRISFRGEVVEISERQGRRHAKVAIQTRYSILDITADGMQEAHLGDRVLIDAGITIKNVKSESP